MQPAILAFLGLTGGLPAWQFDPDRVAGLVRDLDSYRFAIRDAAARELIALGPFAVAPLKRQIAKSPSAEFTQQARRILREVRFRSFNGGPVVGGFRAILRVPEENYEDGADIRMEVELAYSGRREQFLVPPVWWRLSPSAAQSLDPTDTLRQTCDGEIVICPLSGQVLKFDEFLANVDRREREPVTLHGGQSVIDTIALGDLGRWLPPGKYEVELRIQISPPRPLCREPLISNAVRFTIRERKK